MFSRAFATLVLFLLLSACRTSKDYFEKGNRFFESGRYEDAILNYRNAIQKDRKFGEAYYRLALAELKQGNQPAAFAALRAAGALLPDRDDIAVAHADLELGMLLADPRRPDRYQQDLIALSDQLLRRHPDSYDGLRIKGNLALLDRNDDQAVEFFKRANTSKPMQPDVIMLWSQVLLKGDKAPEGEKLALDLVQADKSYGPIYDVLFKYYAAQRRMGDAEYILKAKAENNPAQIEYQMQLALWYAANGKMDAVSPIFQRLIADPKTYPDARLRIGDFYSKLQNLPEALAQYQEGAKANGKDRITYLKRIVDTLLAEGKGHEAEGVIAEILKVQPKDQAARAVDASFLVASHDATKLDAGVKELRELVAESPQNAVWRFNLGLALIAKGDADGAIAQLEESLRNAKEFLPPRLALAQLYYLKRNYEGALRSSDEILASHPGIFEAWLMRTASLIALGKYKEAQTELGRLEKAFPQNSEVQVQLVSLAVAEKRYPEAQRRLEKMYADPATEAKALEGMVVVYGQQDRFDLALKLVTDELKRSPGSDAALALAGNTALRLGRYDQAIEVYQELLKKNPKSPDLLRFIGAAYEAKGDRATAIAKFEEAKNLAPNDTAVIAGLADLLRMAGRNGDAIPLYRKLLELDPENPTGLNNLAYLLTETGGSLDEAQDLVQRALKKMPNEATFMDTLGVVYDKKKQTDSAVHVFEILVAKYPQEPVFHYHFGVVLKDGGRKDRARAEFELALSNGPTPDLRASIDSALKTVQ